MVLILAEGSLGVAIGVMGTMGMSITAEDLALPLSVPPTLVSVGFATRAGLSFGLSLCCELSASSQWRPYVTNKRNRAVGFHREQHCST